MAALFFKGWIKIKDIEDDRFSKKQSRLFAINSQNNSLDSSRQNLDLQIAIALHVAMSFEYVTSFFHICGCFQK